MKKFTLFFGFLFCVFSVENAFGACPAPSNIIITINEQVPANSGIYGVLIRWTPNGGGQSFDVLIERENGDRDTVNITGATRAFIPYTDLYNAIYSFSVRKNCDDTTSSDWSAAIKRLVESDQAQFTQLTVCPGISLDATGHIEGVKEIVVDCETFTGSIKPQVYAGGGSILGYTVERIPYAPPFPIGNVPGKTTQLFTDACDDTWSSPVNLPFPFCFYQNTYNQVVVGANGCLSFNMANALHGCPFNLPPTDLPSIDYDPRSAATGACIVGATIPYSMRNSIMGVYEDIFPSLEYLPSDGGIFQGILGEEPCRTLTISYKKAPAFGHHYPNNPNDYLLNTYQMVLYEGSNVIDIYVRERHQPTTGDGRGLIAVMNAGGNLATVAPGRNSNDPLWSITASLEAEAWRFIPIVNPDNYSLTWYEGRGTDGRIIHSGEELPLNFGELNNDTVTVLLHATSCNGTYFDAQDTTIIRWNVPVSNIYDSICPNTRYIKHGFNIEPQPAGDTIINVTLEPAAGRRCDSIYNLTLKILPERSFEYVENICNGDIYEFDGRPLTDAGRYQKTVPSSVGCDSVVVLNLNVSPALKLTVEEIPDKICADDPNFKLFFNVTEGNTTGFDVQFDEKGTIAAFVSGKYHRETNDEITIDIPNNVRPNHYAMTVTFEDTVFNCGNIVITDIPFTVNYKSSIIEQNWNDVIALLNENYNNGGTGNDNGYKFSHYQWYKNGQPIEGEDRSYIYQPEGLDTTAYYQLQIKRIDDGVTLFTCPLIPVRLGNSAEQPTVVQQRNIVRIASASTGYVNVWSVYGHFINRQNIQSNFTEINFSAAGVYILEIILDNGLREVEKIVIQ